MDTNSKNALNGSLVSTATKKVVKGGGVEFWNRLNIPVRLAWIGYDGLHHQLSTIEPNDSSGIGPCYQGGCFLFTSSFSGAFIAVVRLTTPSTTSYELSPPLLAHPNDIGGYPQPSTNSPIPGDSPRVLVGCGLLPNRNPIAREQFWARGSDSYMLAAGERRVVSFTESHGLDRTSSEQSTVAKSASASVSGGWGPVSASASASLSQTSTTSHQVSVRTEQTRYESVELDNSDNAVSSLFLKWTLTDIITIFNKGTGKPEASIIQRERPILVGGPYNLDALPAEKSVRVATNLPKPPGVLLIHEIQKAPGRTAVAADRAGSDAAGTVSDMMDQINAASSS